LRRNTEDIARALRAGERWREDIRQATDPLRVEKTTNGIAVLVIPQSKVDVAYWSYNGQVWRQSGADWEPQSFCAGVKASEMIRDVRPAVESWRWELELKTGRKTPSVRPLFSFQAVPGKAAGTNLAGLVHARVAP
jgi:hypothetical protein